MSGGVDENEGERLGRAVAFASGDLRDWPSQCGECASENLLVHPKLDVLECLDCHYQTTQEVVYQLRVERARKELKACGPCAAYQRGERQDESSQGFPIHACERVLQALLPSLPPVPDLDVFALTTVCPCGCDLQTPPGPQETA